MWRIEFDELMRTVYIENDVKGIRKAILMYTPSIREWVDELAPKLIKEGWELETLNGGVKDDAIRIDEVLDVLKKVLEVLL